MYRGEYGSNRDPGRTVIRNDLLWHGEIQNRADQNDDDRTPNIMTMAALAGGH